MSKIAAVTGLVLIAIGLAGYGLPQAEVTDQDGNIIEQTSSVTALIPAFFGIPILLFGLWGTLKPAANKHAMHGAVLFAAIGALAATGRGIVSLLKLVNADGEFNTRAFAFLVLMGGICWMFVIACVKSFIDARKLRESEL